MIPVALHDAVTSDDIICLGLCLLFLLVVFISSLVLDEICYPLHTQLVYLFPVTSFKNVTKHLHEVTRLELDYCDCYSTLTL